MIQIYSAHCKKHRIVSIESRLKMRPPKGFMPKFIPDNTGITHTAETRKNMSIAHKGQKPWNTGKKRPEITGKNHPRWIKNRTELKTDRQKSYDTKYKYWMLEVKRRDGWKCKINNKDCHGSLEAHHILPWRDYPELRYEINNGITLCHAHHPLKRAEEKLLIPKFRGLIGVPMV